MNTPPKIGQTTQDSALIGRRDAFHVPAILVCSDQVIYPGNSLQFDDTYTKVSYVSQENCQALADVFMSDPATPGTCFWAFLLPGTTANLTHHFEIVEKPVDKPNLEEDYTQYQSEGNWYQDYEDDGDCKGCFD